MTLSALSYNDLPLVLARLQTLGELHAPCAAAMGLSVSDRCRREPSPI